MKWDGQKGNYITKKEDKEYKEHFWSIILDCNVDHLETEYLNIPISKNFLLNIPILNALKAMFPTI